MSAVETQPDVGGFSVVVEGMACEPHDRRYVFDAQLVTFASSPHLPRVVGVPRSAAACSCQYSAAVNLTVQSWNVVTGTPKPVHVFPNRGARHGLEFLGRQCHPKDQSAAICPVHQGTESRNG